MAQAYLRKNRARRHSCPLHIGEMISADSTGTFSPFGNIPTRAVVIFFGGQLSAMHGLAGFSPVKCAEDEDEESTGEEAPEPVDSAEYSSMIRSQPIRSQAEA